LEYKIIESELNVTLVVYVNTYKDKKKGSDTFTCNTTKQDSFEKKIVSCFL